MVRILIGDGLDLEVSDLEQLLRLVRAEIDGESRRAAYDPHLPGIDFAKIEQRLHGALIEATA